MSIKKRPREEVSLGEEELHILGRGMENLNDSWIFKEVKERIKIDFGGESIDDGPLIAIANLDQTKLRVVGAIPHKLSIDSDIGSPFEISAEGI